MRDSCRDSSVFNCDWTLTALLNPSLGDRKRPVCWANGPMASHESSRVPPPHDNPAAAARPKPLWQPWSDSDGSIVFTISLPSFTYSSIPFLKYDSLLISDDRELNHRTGDNDGGSASKELPTRTKKERRRHERHHELLSTAARAARKE